MTNTYPDRPLLKSMSKVWCYSNGGVPWGIEHTRREAIKQCEQLCEQPWSEIKAFCEVRKVTLVDGWDSKAGRVSE